MLFGHFGRLLEATRNPFFFLLSQGTFALLSLGLWIRPSIIIQSSFSPPLPNNIKDNLGTSIAFIWITCTLFAWLFVWYLTRNTFVTLVCEKLLFFSWDVKAVFLLWGAMECGTECSSYKTLQSGLLHLCSDNLQILSMWITNQTWSELRCTWCFKHLFYVDK